MDPPRQTASILGAFIIDFDNNSTVDGIAGVESVTWQQLGGYQIQRKHS